MKDLFTPVTRDERQEESVKKWIKSKGRGTIVACTGYGKTRVATIIIGKLIPAGTGMKAYDDIIVGSKDEYEELIASKGF